MLGAISEIVMGTVNSNRGGVISIVGEEGTFSTDKTNALSECGLPVGATVMAGVDSNSTIVSFEGNYCAKNCERDCSMHALQALAGQLIQQGVEL